jgi:ligand-binding SRPBCC domain-containing protein
MTTWEVSARLRVARPRAEVFAFFADAGNLEALTPPWLSFRIQTPRPIEMHPGALIDYRLSVRGLPVRWRTEITTWEPPVRFVDKQLRGPYRLWVHEHTFEETADGGTLVGDRVRYRVPFGRLANWLVVERDVRTIFRYRTETLLRMFGGKPEDAEPVVIREVQATQEE